jgi:hypothetical protein
MVVDRSEVEEVNNIVNNKMGNAKTQLTRIDRAGDKAGDATKIKGLNMRHRLTSESKLHECQRSRETVV